jgi:beta-lactamase regulating signal transducer with metallopeptidase domain
MISTLARASLDGGIVVAIVWIVTRLFRLSPATRATLWWCAAAKFVVALFWAQPILLPVLPPAEVSLPLSIVSIGANEPTPSADGRTSRVEQTQIESAVVRERWSLALVGLWAIGCAVAAGIGASGVSRMKRIIARSSTAPHRIREMANALSIRIGLRRVPRLLVSDDVDTPLVAGLFRPVVLLPNHGFTRLRPDQQFMVLCHELAHVKRGDLWFGWAPAIAERAFFFHPLAHLAAREYSLWREAACDAAVLDALEAAPREYGCLLLDLGMSRRRTGLAAAGAPWSFPNLKRRIVMLQDSSMRMRSRRSRVLSAAIVGCAVVAILPMQLVARPAQNEPASELLAEPARQDREPDLQRLREEVEQVRALQAERLRELEQSLRRDRAAQVEQHLQRAHVAELELNLERHRGELLALEQNIARIQRAESGNDDVRFVALFSDDSTTMSGESGDAERARRYRRNNDPMIWFLYEGREYVTRDPQNIEKLREIWKPVYEIGDRQGILGAEQGKLGAKQGELGEIQGKLGTKQGELGALQGRLGEQQALLAAREALIASRSERDSFERERRKIEGRMRELTVEMAALEMKMRELDEPMRKLNEPMEELARQMATLSGRMEEVGSRARSETKQLLERAVANGSAEIVR